MTDWATISQVGTAAGTLVLAVATFSSVRSGARSARIAERSLLLGIRPVLAPARPTDPDETIGFGDGHRSHVSGGRVAVDQTEAGIYFAMSLRNVGPGLAVLHAWHLAPGMGARLPRPDLEDFRRLQRDLYVPAGDLGFWQGVVRGSEDQFMEGLAEAIDGRGRLTLDLLYGERPADDHALRPDSRGGGVGMGGRRRSPLEPRRP